MGCAALVRARFSRAGSSSEEIWGQSMVPLLVLLLSIGVCLLGRTLLVIGRIRCCSGWRPSRLALHFFQGVLLVGSETGLSRRNRFPKRGSIVYPLLLDIIHVFFKKKKGYLVHLLLDLQVAKREPTSCYDDAYSVGTPEWAFWVKYGQTHCKTTFLPRIGVFCWLANGPFFISGCWFFGCFTVAELVIRAGRSSFTPDQLSVEFVCMGGWLRYGDLALDSCAQFLAVAEHKLIPSRAKSICHQLWKAGYQSVWAPACQDQIAGGHAGVVVVSLDCAPVALSTCATSAFKEFFRLGRALRTTLPSGMVGVVRLFVVYGYQGTEEDSEKLQLTDKLLQADLAEAQVVCVRQPLLVAGDLNADPAVIPCLAKGISAGRFVDLALAYSLAEGRKPDATCKFRLGECAGARRDIIVGCSNALAASTACKVTDRWFTPRFSVFASFCITRWTAEVACPVGTQPVWPACWIGWLFFISCCSGCLGYL